MTETRLAQIPVPLRWTNDPTSFEVTPDEHLVIQAGPHTDLFRDPLGTQEHENAPRLMFSPAPEYVLSARVTVDFADVFDAGVLMVYATDRYWAKLCFEFTPSREPSIVSVVNRECSDDCNSHLVDGNEVFLRIARLGRAFAFHSSGDGRTWGLVRYFSLDEPARPFVGFAAQSPNGEGCTATFSEIRYEEQRLSDIRSGA